MFQYIQDMRLSVVIICFVSRVLELILASNDITASLANSVTWSLYCKHDFCSWKPESCYTWAELISWWDVDSETVPQYSSLLVWLVFLRYLKCVSYDNMYYIDVIFILINYWLIRNCFLNNDDVFHLQLY